MNILIAFLGFLAFILPLGSMIVKEKRITPLGIVLCLVAIAIGTLSIKHSNDDDTFRTSLTNNLTMSKDSVALLISLARQDSLRDAEFEERLFEEFKIKRDSISNQPVKAIINIGKNEIININ